MANAYAINYSLASTTNSFSAIWKTTRVMKAAGWTVVGVSDGANKRTLTTGGTPASNANDYWGSNADPLADTYPGALDSVSAWIVMRGPSTIKLSFTTAPGDLIRGEGVTQANTGATGEVMGVVWDSVGSTGWAVIAPRTGTFNDSDIVTGDLSLETFTPTDMLEYVREVMFHKTATVTTTTAYYICANNDGAGEVASLFSSLADSTGCTNLVGPAQGGTDNAFPSIAMIVWGAADATTGTTSFGISSSLSAFGQTSCANATPAAGVSADGSFYSIIATAGSPRVFAFTKCDNTEPGDIDPYVWYGSSYNNTLTSWTNNTTTNTSSAVPSFSNITNAWYGYFIGYVGRSVSGRDKAVAFFGRAFNISWYYSGINARLHSYPQATGSTPLLKENFSLCSTRTTEVWWKGIPRWIFISSLGTFYDTYDDKTFIVIGERQTTNNPALIIGPSDGSTTPAAS